MKLLIALVCLFPVVLLAQVAPSPVPAPVGPVSNFIASHGGFYLTALLLAGCANSVLSAIRDVLAALDGVPKGGVIPEDKKALTAVNRICIALGKVIDYVQGNVQH